MIRIRVVIITDTEDVLLCALSGLILRNLLRFLNK